MSLPYITMVVVESKKQNLTITTAGEYKNDQEAIDHLVENLKFMIQCLEDSGKVIGELSHGKRLFIRHQLMTEDQFPVEEAILA